MLGSQIPTASSVQTTPTIATATSPTRPSRLRGLSYLRSYTHNHLHSSRSDSTPTPPLLTRTASSPRNASPTRSTSLSTPSVTTGPPRRANTDERGNNTTAVPPSRIESGENGWIPTIQGRSGLSRESLHPTTTNTESAAPEPTTTAAMMTRNRAATAVLGPVPTSVHPNRRPSALDVSVSSDQPPMPEPSTSAPGPSKDLPSIRFIPHVETRSSRPSLHFTALSRTLKNPHNVVRVGRYSERDIASNEPNTLPVGFKSKVVSRRHCEFWCTDGQWYIKDVKSSSGTFLNHVRLSSPGVESRPYPVNDGDVVQLGIDFKGGEEVIFRCVKIRVECNRGWQKSLNSFNTSAHKRLLKNALRTQNRDSDAASVNSSECSICLNAVAPCQALFVAPCSHVWHYKCVRNLIHSPQWPNFVCPNCRFVADLEADVEQPEDDDLDIDDAAEQSLLQAEVSGSSDDNAASLRNDEQEGAVSTTPRLGTMTRNDDQVDEDLAALLSQTALTATPLGHSSREDESTLSTTSSRPIKIGQPSSSSRTPSDPIGARSMTPTTHTQFALAAGPIAEGPLTPRNDAGPFILDGSAARDNSLATQPVTEVSEPNSVEDVPPRMG